MINRTFLNGCNSYYNHYIAVIKDTEFKISEAMRIGFVINGTASIRLFEKYQILHPGDLFFFPQKSFYSITSVSGIWIYGIDLEPEYFHSFCPHLESIHFNQFYLSINSSDQIRADLYSWIRSFLLTNTNENEYLLLNAISSLNQVFSFLCDHYRETAIHTNNQETYHQMEQILSYITSHMSDQLRISDISREVGFHPQYFSIFFSRHFHIPFIAFLNQLRIDRSLSALCSDDPAAITDIAIQYGFQTYKAYSNAFHKYYGMSPSQYRKSNRGNTNLSFTQETKEAVEMCLKLLESSLPYQTPITVQENVEKIQVTQDLVHTPTLFHDHRFLSVNVGTAYLLLHDNVYQQLRQVISECHMFTHIHVSDIFNDMLKVYRETTPGKPQFHWGETDLVIERICSLECFPFIELGYMPRQLASSADSISFGYYRCTGVPKSLAIWKEMISSFLNHYLEKYGLEALKKWRFDFWASANMQTLNGFWHGTQEQFFAMYKATYEAFQETNDQLRPGSPNFSIPGGLDWYEAFLKMCSKHRILPGYLNINLFDMEDNIKQFSLSNLNPASTYNYLSSTNENTKIQIIKQIQSLFKTTNCPELPIVVSLWNTTYSLTDLIRDTAFMTCHVIRTWIQTMPYLDGLSFFCLSDMNESIIQDDPFSGSAGMISLNGIAKPSFNAFYLLQKLDRNIIYEKSPCLITRGNGRFHVLVYNLCDYEKIMPSEELTYLAYYHRYQIFHTNGTLRFLASLSVPSGHYKITRYMVDREHGCAYDEWIRMGCPTTITEEITKSLKAASCPSVFYEEKDATSDLRLQADIKPHGVVLFEILCKKKE